MGKYINVRITRSADGTEWLLQAQKDVDLNWDTIRTCFAEVPFFKQLVIKDAYPLARELSEHTENVVNVYDENENTLKSYLRGKALNMKEG